MAVRRAFYADVETVASLMTDPEFIVDRCIAIGELDAECAFEDDDDGVRLLSKRRARHDLPGFLTRLVGETQVLTVDEYWDAGPGDRHGHYSVTTAMAPIEIRGDFSLVAAEGGCVYEVRHSFRIPIPLIAGKIEKVLRRQITETVAAELDYAAARLTPDG